MRWMAVGAFALLVAGGAASLSWGLSYETVPAVPSGPLARPVPEAQTAAVPAGVIDASVLRERPLFSPGRRPPEAPAVATAGTVVGDPPTVQGVAIAGTAAFALVKAGDRVRRVALGGAVEGWTVVGIERRRVTLRSDGGDLVIDLRSQGAGIIREAEASTDGEASADGMDPDT